MIRLRTLSLVSALLAASLTALLGQAQDGSPALPRGWKPFAHPHDSKLTAAENSIGMKFVVTPPGEFQMGAAADDQDAEDDEKPRRPVQISRAFYFGLHEVTLGQFLKFYHAAKYKTDAEKRHGGYGYDEASNTFKKSSIFVPWTTGFKQSMDHPAVNVSWNDAQAFCKWLSAKEGQSYRLPTEAEWEYACRGGTTSKFSCGDDPESLALYGNLADAAGREKFNGWFWALQANDGFAFSAPVGSFRPNPFGIYDLHGNAWEWCEDGYDPKEYGLRSAIAGGSAARSGNLTNRVLRGGGWNNNSAVARSANRGGIEPNECHPFVGFRVVAAREP